MKDKQTIHTRMTEYEEAIKIANAILNGGHGHYLYIITIGSYTDPDDDIRILARQFLRLSERANAKAQTTLSRREELIAAVAKVGVTEAVRRIKSVAQETSRWRSLWSKLWRNKPELEAPEIVRLLGLVGAIALSAAFAGPICGSALALALWVGALICWAAHRRARKV